MTAELPEDFSELVDGDFDRVDLVGKSANGHRALIAKADPAPTAKEPNMPDTDTVEPVAKDTAVAPAVSDGADVSEGGETDQLSGLADHDADSPDAEMEAVAKADDEVAADPEAVDLAEPLAEGTGDGVVGDELVPGSPAWEDVDAATARKWTAVLGRTRNALEVLSQREMVEADTGADGDGFENAFDLEDAGCAIDYAISVLAGYAASEEIDATIGTEALAAVGKAAEGIDPAALSVLEQYAPVAKAGRVLSAANEAEIRSASDSLQKVLASLPSAPVADDVAKADDAPNVPAVDGVTTADSAEPVAVPSPDTSSSSASVPVSKEAAAAVAEAVAAAVAKADEPPAVEEPVAKADDALAKVSEADLKRQALTGSGSEQKAALAELGLRVLMGSIGTDPAAEPDDTTDAAADAAAPADATDATAPAPAPAPTSAEEPVAKTAQDVLKEIIEQEVGVALTVRDEAHQAVVKGLQERIDKLEAPARPKVLSNGVQRDPNAAPPQVEPHVMRGQNVGELRHDTVAKDAWMAASDAGERKAIGDEMEQAAAEALRQLHGRRPPPPR